jgi:hypothetical protein
MQDTSSSYQCIHLTKCDLRWYLLSMHELRHYLMSVWVTWRWKLPKRNFSCHHRWKHNRIHRNSLWIFKWLLSISRVQWYLSWLCYGRWCNSSNCYLRSWCPIDNRRDHSNSLILKERQLNLSLCCLIGWLDQRDFNHW